jgi:hypothetical protein
VCRRPRRSWDRSRARRPCAREGRRVRQPRVHSRQDTAARNRAGPLAQVPVGPRSRSAYRGVMPAVGALVRCTDGWWITAAAERPARSPARRPAGWLVVISSARAAAGTQVALPELSRGGLCAARDGPVLVCSLRCGCGRAPRLADEG